MFGALVTGALMGFAFGIIDVQGSGSAAESWRQFLRASRCFLSSLLSSLSLYLLFSFLHVRVSSRISPFPFVWCSDTSVRPLGAAGGLIVGAANQYMRTRDEAFDLAESIQYDDGLLDA